MNLLRTQRAIKFVLAILALLFSPTCTRSHAQAAMLMEESFGFFGFLTLRVLESRRILTVTVRLRIRS